MGTRGRRSAADLSIVPIGIDTRRPEPPAKLNANEAATWHAIVRDLPGGWVTPAQEPLLSAYCWHIETGTRLSNMIDATDFASADLRRLGRLLQMRYRETAAVASLATKMRLTSQSRMHPRTAGRRSQGQPPGPRPWDQND
jgi:hypothetical protein